MDVVRGKTSLNRGIPLQNRASVSSSARVSHSVLSHGVRIQQDASVEGSVLMPGARVARGAQLRRAIIEEGVEIPADFHAGCCQ